MKLIYLIVFVLLGDDMRVPAHQLGNQTVDFHILMESRVFLFLILERFINSKV